MSQKDRKQFLDGFPPEPKKMADLLQSCGVRLTQAQVRNLWNYHQLLRQHNPELNLTRIHNFTSMVLKLYVDSILPGHLITLPSPLLDLGTGPGMPGIPLKIAFPQIEIFLAESRQRRVDFLGTVLASLDLEGIEVIGEKVTSSFQGSMAGVITRALESISSTLKRISGCLLEDGQAIFMKGPNCDLEIEEALRQFGREYRLLYNRFYTIPNTPHQRRLVVFQRTNQPPWIKRVQAMKRHAVRKIDSEKNELFRALKKLLGSRGIKKEKKALVAGAKQVVEVLRGFPELCEAWISSGGGLPPPSDAPDHLAWFQVDPHLFQKIDVFGTASPLLLVRIHTIPKWEPQDGLPEGCTVFIPFQDPENVGAAIRSAVAFGATGVILLAESAHPYHPKSLRASGGAVLRAHLLEGPSLNELPVTLSILALSSEGKDISQAVFPKSFGLLIGMEGPGLPEQWKKDALAIPIMPEMESLNAATATAISLYVWSQAAKPDPWLPMPLK
jgi:16S rRNA (guanine(527)-N(7))-methyltransferase RsmG